MLLNINTSKTDAMKSVTKVLPKMPSNNLGVLRIRKMVTTVLTILIFLYFLRDSFKKKLMEISIKLAGWVLKCFIFDLLLKRNFYNKFDSTLLLLLLLLFFW